MTIRKTTPIHTSLYEYPATFRGLAGPHRHMLHRGIDITHPRGPFTQKQPKLSKSRGGAATRSAGELGHLSAHAPSDFEE